METKICTKCKLEKNITEFVSSKRIKSGVTSKCKECNTKYKKEYYYSNFKIINEKNKEYYKANKEEIRNKIKDKYKNDEEYRNKLKEYEKNNIEKIRERKKNYKQKNKEKIIIQTNKYRRNKKEKDKLYFITCKIRGIINKAIKRNNFTKTSNSFTILGCDNIFLKKHIEDKWSESHNLDVNGNIWMSWDNYGKYEYGCSYFGWDIDHIIPLNSAKTEDDIIRLNHYSNLQPLCSYINRNIKDR